MKINDDTVLPFGAHRGMTARAIAKHDPTYIGWLHYRTDHDVKCSFTDRCCAAYEEEHNYDVGAMTEALG